MHVPPNNDYKRWYVAKKPYYSQQMLIYRQKLKCCRGTWLKIHIHANNIHVPSTNDYKLVVRSNVTVLFATIVDMLPKNCKLLWYMVKNSYLMRIICTYRQILTKTIVCSKKTVLFATNVDVLPKFKSCRGTY